MPPRRDRKSPDGGTPKIALRANASGKATPLRRRAARAEDGLMLRMLKPDLLCGLGGFVLGTAALLLLHPATPSPVPPTRTDILALAVAGPSPHHARPHAG